MEINNPEVKSRVKNLYCWLDAISPKFCEAVVENIGAAPSKRWIQVLNTRERLGKLCVFASKSSGVERRIKDAIVKRRILNHRVAIFISIDATHVSTGLEISTANTAIMGRSVPKPHD